MPAYHLNYLNRRLLEVVAGSAHGRTSPAHPAGPGQRAEVVEADSVRELVATALLC